jgi:FlaA1/EpsC-like NDP-sugar epimerase
MLNEQARARADPHHEVDTIYHAAAYKHVPLLEHNEVVGVENNVIGTLVLARAALDAKLTRFTMISTDKAVRPESVMGASKRVAELVIQAFAEDPGLPHPLRHRALRQRARFVRARSCSASASRSARAAR